MDNNRIIKRYCKAVKKALKACGCYQKSIVANLELLAADYLSEYPEATELSFKQHFGEPEAYAKEYAATIPNDVLVHKLQTKKRITRAVAIGIGAALILLVLGITLVLLDVHSAHYGYRVDFNF